MPVSMQERILEEIKIDDVDGKRELISYRSIENSLQKREFEPLFEKEVDSGERTTQIMDGVRRYMLINNLRWADLIKRFELSRKG